jgi:hypothetical protein
MSNTQRDGQTTFDIREEELAEPGRTIPIDQKLKVAKVNVKKGKGGSGITLTLLDK